MNLDKFTSKGKFLMLALDHRGSFKKLMNPQDPESVTDQQVIDLKNDIIEALKDEFSALLIDEAWGLEACHEVCRIKPFLLPLEKSSHTGVVELEHTAADLIKLGASGAKILFDFNPGNENAGKQLEIAKKVAEDCRAADFPLFLEIVTHTIGLHLRGGVENLSGSHLGGGLDYLGGESVVIESVKSFQEEGITPDVWKLEFPGSQEACLQLTQLVGNTPWILLTGGDSFEDFKNKLEIASQGGTKGFLAGRALWQEVCTLDGEEKKKFLRETLPQRFKEVSEIISNH